MFTAKADYFWLGVGLRGKMQSLSWPPLFYKELMSLLLSIWLHWRQKRSIYQWITKIWSFWIVFPWNQRMLGKFQLCANANATITIIMTIIWWKFVDMISNSLFLKTYDLSALIKVNYCCKLRSQDDSKMCLWMWKSAEVCICLLDITRIYLSSSVTVLGSHVWRINYV